MIFPCSHFDNAENRDGEGPWTSSLSTVSDLKKNKNKNYTINLEETFSNVEIYKG